MQDAAPAGATSGRARGALLLAHSLSLVLHPFVVSPAAVVLLLWLATGDLRQALGWAGLCAGMVVAPALVWLRVALWQRRYGDADVSVRRERYGFYLFGLACMVACYAVLLRLEAPAVLRGGFRAALLAAVTSALANRFWAKVSVHAGTLAGVAALAAPYSWPLALVLGGVAASVTWARIALGRHTLTEALAGWAIALGCVLAADLPWG